MTNVGIYSIDIQTDKIFLKICIKIFGVFFLVKLNKNIEENVQIQYPKMAIIPKNQISVISNASKRLFRLK
ncbi:unnamed protein product [Blepharisma stoltei]|uniref:Uncharacterized protein n=1 Tax=Blepharisma stoltei TaxID=1481888 RepID=A0AAU9JFY0_9CILI|nr:unnamed protein product [Blepharisma stoltei]